MKKTVLAEKVTKLASNMEENDWIIENIRVLLKEKGIKVETVSRELGISQGEFSKIINGHRKDYFKYLPQIAESLGVSFHRLVTPAQFVQNNYGSINDHGNGMIGHVYHSNNPELYERILEECREKDKLKDALLMAEKEAKEELRRKYEECLVLIKSMKENKSNKTS